MTHHPITRRVLLHAAGAVGLARSLPTIAASEPPPEVTRLRLIKLRSICVAPQYVAEELFRAEGFTDIQYIDPGAVGASGVPAARALGQGAVDINVNFAAPLVMALARRFGFGSSRQPIDPGLQCARSVFPVSILPMGAPRGDKDMTNRSVATHIWSRLSQTMTRSS